MNERIVGGDEKRLAKQWSVRDALVKAALRGRSLMPYTGQQTGEPVKNVGKTGFSEWGSRSYNIGVGCSNNCVYCVERRYGLQFRGVKSREDWANEKLKELPPRICKFEGTVIMPTAHDITPFYLPVFQAQLIALLEAGNKVLVVSKPRLECIRPLCAVLPPYKDQLTFRFTIGTFDRKLAKLWESGAPSPSERFACLRHAFDLGFTTSVSMEPMLAGTEDALITFTKLIPFVTETIWIGKMRHVNRWGSATPQIAAACWYIRKLQCDAAILDLVRKLDHHPQVRWKDSIRQVIENCRPRASVR